MTHSTQEDAEAARDRFTDTWRDAREQTAQVSHAALIYILNWDDALALSRKLSSFYANNAEIAILADAIWNRAQEMHQLDKDERYG